MKYTAIIKRGEEAGYIAFCPALKGCIAQGSTKKEVLKNLRLAMEDYIECLIEDGISIPREIGKEIIEMEVVTR